jgi:hypothetical protein
MGPSSPLERSAGRPHYADDHLQMPHPYSSLASVGELVTAIRIYRLDKHGATLPSTTRVRNHSSQRPVLRLSR